MAIRIDHEGLWNGDTLIIPHYIDNGTVLDRQVQVESSPEDLTRVTITIATVEEVTVAEQYGKQVPL